MHEPPLDPYERTLATAFNAGHDADPSIIMNRDLQHARAVVDQILKNSKKEIVVASQRLNSEAYDLRTIMRSLRSNKELEIRIILETGKGIDPDGTINANQINDSWIPSMIGKDDDFSRIQIRVSSTPPKHHFIVGDDRWVRIETDHEKAEAIVFLNDIERSKRLKIIFNKHWESAKIASIKSKS